MNTTESFANCDRYVFDFNYCSFKKGFAQLQTTEDAHYLGNWVNFKSLELITYCEGDITINKCDNVEEFKKQLFKVVSWYKNNDSFEGIDLMDSKEIKEDFNKLNLDNSFYLHKSYLEV
tara:strand:- start:505 stop:861 length:357 start_codon:yes stop_codon:yes gene_type:complete